MPSSASSISVPSRSSTIYTSLPLPPFRSIGAAAAAAKSVVARTTNDAVHPGVAIQAVVAIASRKVVIVAVEQHDAFDIRVSSERQVNVDGRKYRVDLLGRRSP